MIKEPNMDTEIQTFLLKTKRTMTMRIITNAQFAMIYIRDLMIIILEMVIITIRFLIWIM